MNDLCLTNDSFELNIVTLLNNEARFRKIVVSQAPRLESFISHDQFSISSIGIGLGDSLSPKTK